MQELLARIKKSGISIRANEEQLRLFVPDGCDVTALLPEIKSNKAALLAYIKQVKAQNSQLRPVKPAPADHYELFYQPKKEYIRFLLMGDFAYNSNLLMLYQHLERPVLERVLETLFERHEALRTTFYHQDDKFYQRVHASAPVASMVQYFDLSEEPAKEQLAQQIVEQAHRHRFNFENELMVDIKLAKVLPDTHVLMMTLHHAICDDLSIKVLKRELEQLYKDYAAGRPSSLPPVQWQYKDYAAWINDLLRGPAAVSARAYYHSRLTASIEKEYGLPLQELPVKTYRQELLEELEHNPRFHLLPAKEVVFGSIVRIYPPPGARYNTFFELALLTSLHQLAAAYNTSLSVLLTAAFAVMMQQEGQPQLRIYVPRSSRTYAEFENIVGWLTAEIIVCIDTADKPDFSTLLHQVQQVFLEAAEYSFYPHEALLNQLNLPLSVVAPYLLNYIPVENDALNDNIDTSSWHDTNGSGHFNFRCEVYELRQGLKLTVNYNSDLYTAADAERMIASWKRILQELVAAR